MGVLKKCKSVWNKISKKSNLRESKENLSPKELYITKTKKTKKRRFKFFLKAIQGGTQGYDNLASLGSTDSSISLTSRSSLQQVPAVRIASNETAADVNNEMLVDVVAEIHSHNECMSSPFQPVVENNYNTRNLMSFDELDEPVQFNVATETKTSDVDDSQLRHVSGANNTPCINTPTTNNSSIGNADDVDAGGKEEYNENTPTVSVSIETLDRRQLPDILAENTSGGHATIDIVQELRQNVELMKCKLEEKDEKIKLLEIKYAEVLNEKAAKENENEYLTQSILGAEKNIKQLQDEMETFKSKMMKKEYEMETFKSKMMKKEYEMETFKSKMESLMEESAAVQQDKIDKISEEMKRLKESSQQANLPVVIHKPKTCQVNLGKKGVMNTRNGSSDSSSSSSPQSSSSSERETASPECLSSPSLSTDEHDTDLPFGLEECSHDETYKREVYPSEIAWNELQNLDFPEATELPLETIEEADEQTSRKAVYENNDIDDEQAWHKELYQDSDIEDEQACREELYEDNDTDDEKICRKEIYQDIDIDGEQTCRKEIYQHTDIDDVETCRKEVYENNDVEHEDQVSFTKKMGIGQLYEGFIALHYFLGSHAFSPFDEQPEKYMRIVDFLVSNPGVDLNRFLDLIGVPVSAIPEDVRQAGDRVVVSYAVYTWCCRQSGPNATGSSLAVAMSAKLSNMLKPEL